MILTSGRRIVEQFAGETPEPSEAHTHYARKLKLAQQALSQLNQAHRLLGQWIQTEMTEGDEDYAFELTDGISNNLQSVIEAVEGEIDALQPMLDMHR